MTNLFASLVSVRVDGNVAARSEFALALEVATYSGAAGVVYGRKRSLIKQTGNPFGAHDLLSAAHAMSLDVALVTHNLK